MASIINASTAGVGGLISTADNSGVLHLQTGGINAITIDASQNVGIGKSPSYKLDVATIALAANQSGGVRFGYDDQFGMRLNQGTTGSGVPYAQIMGPKDGNGWLAFTMGSSDTERMRIDANGIVTGSAGNLQLISRTVQTATGSAVDFTSIPSWVKRITVILNGVSTNNTGPVQIQLGVGGVVQTTGYSSATFSYNSTTASTSSSGLILDQGSPSGGAGAARTGNITICSLGNNTWVSQGVIITSNVTPSAGSVTLSGTLDILRVMPQNGTFDAGSINIMYE